MLTGICNKLIASGVGAGQAVAKASLFQDALSKLPAPPAGCTNGVHHFYIPGRIEVLGKHTDYAGGRSLVCALERAICLVARQRVDNQIRIIDARDGSTALFPISADLVPEPGNWTNYPMTVARRLALNFPGKLSGLDIAFASDLPPAAGMSSSSALIVGVFFALARANNVAQIARYAENISGNEDLAAYLGAVESGQTFRRLKGDTGVGTSGGSQDHTAILCSIRSHLSQFAFCPVRRQRDVPMPDGYVFVIGSSGVVAEKTREAREKYNRASRAVREIVRIWEDSTGSSVNSLAEAASSVSGAEALRAAIRQSTSEEFSEQELLNRFEQFFAESFHIVPQAADCLANGEIKQFGELVSMSQAAAESLLGNQVPETVWLARSAKEFGAAAASAFGAGFGGSVWALVEASSADAFLASWRDSYTSRFPKTASRSTFFVSKAGPALISF